MQSKRRADEAHTHHSPENTKAALLSAAKSLFSQKGFDGTTVKELAEKAGVNISLVSYHFQGKEGLYRACLEQFGRNRLSVAERLLQSPGSKAEFRVRLEMFVSEMLNCFVEEPELTKLIHRECELELPVAQDIFKETFLQIFETLVEFFKASAKIEAIESDLDHRILAASLLGTLVHFARMDKLSLKFLKTSINEKSYREKLGQQVIRLFLSGCLNERQNLTDVNKGLK